VRWADEVLVVDSHSADRTAALVIHEEFLAQFIASFPTPPEALILDFSERAEIPRFSHEQIAA